MLDKYLPLVTLFQQFMFYSVIKGVSNEEIRIIVLTLERWMFFIKNDKLNQFFMLDEVIKCILLHCMILISKSSICSSK